MYAFTCALQGHMENHIGMPTRFLLLVIAFFLIMPATVLIQIGAATALMVTIIYNVRPKRSRN
jgi:TRAP-type uncharacterized transport system fused permease subunit